MAQTRRRRQTKHRGNAAGVVVARGRTGRKPTAAERSEGGRSKEDQRQRRAERYNRPPTWRGAFTRAILGSVLVAAVGVLLVHQKAPSVILWFGATLVLYLPLIYYTDMWLYRRRLRRQGATGTGTARP